MSLTVSSRATSSQVMGCGGISTGLPAVEAPQPIRMRDASPSGTPRRAGSSARARARARFRLTLRVSYFHWFLMCAQSTGLFAVGDYGGTDGTPHSCAADGSDAADGGGGGGETAIR